MHRPPARMSQKLEALLDERDHLHIAISLEADRPDADPEKLLAMGRRLAQVECLIDAERRSLPTKMGRELH